MRGAINVSLTVDERDEIDAAKGRARRLLECIREHELIPESDEAAGLAELLDVVKESIERIDSVFATADARRAKVGAR